MAGKVTLAGARVSANLTQEQMAEALGVTRQTVYLMEAGKIDIRPAYLLAWGKITGFDLRDLSLPKESTTT